jgi:hypothetical protein
LAKFDLMIRRPGALRSIGRSAIASAAQHRQGKVPWNGPTLYRSPDFVSRDVTNSRFGRQFLAEMLPKLRKTNLLVSGFEP